jgi:hypothetical protein
MFIALMLVGYAASKITDNKTGTGTWHQAWFTSQNKRRETTPATAEDPNWALGADAWVSLPAEAVPR